MTENLDKAILINESKSELIAGDINLFKNAHRASEALEVIDVQNGEYFAYRLDGKKLKIEIHNGDIWFTEEPDPASMEIVRDLLVQTAEHVLRARAGRTNKVEAQGRHIDLGQLSTPDLVKLIGFSA